jgi:hypothetical protein
MGRGPGTLQVASNSGVALTGGSSRVEAHGSGQPCKRSTRGLVVNDPACARHLSTYPLSSASCRWKQT